MRACTKTIVLALRVLLFGVVVVEAQAGQPSSIQISNVTPRRDVGGDIVDAHDGCLHKFGDRYFLYGTAYDKTNGFGKSNRYHCYSSADLVTWRHEGELLSQPPEGVYYRPYVVYNAKAGKYVLWYNWYPTLWNGQYGVATSDTPQGPFTIHNSNVKVSQPAPGDMGLFLDDDGTGYLIYTSIAKNHGIFVERLSDDYLGSTQENSGLLATGCEAPLLFKRQGAYCALFDNCCCFCPGGSGARVYVAGKPLGPYAWKNNLNINRDAKGVPIIHAQQTHVAQLPTPGGVLYVWMGDRWGSTLDKIKGHDFQYWGPLEFNSEGNLLPLKWTDQWTIDLGIAK